MNRAAAPLVLLVFVVGLLTGYVIGNTHRADARDAISNDKPMTIVQSTTASTERTSYLAQPDLDDVYGGRRDTDRQRVEPESSGAPSESTPATRTPASTAETATAEELSLARMKADQYQATIKRLTLELDECTNGPDSVLATLRALPEWPTLDDAQHRTVAAFIERFPVHLLPGEATLIATHTSPIGATTQELIRMLGPARVRAALSIDAQAAMQHDDPDEWAEYFGTAF